MALTRRSVLSGGAAAASLAFGAPAVLGAQETRQMRLGVISPAADVWAQNAEALAGELAEESDGRLTLSVFPSGQLGNEAQMLQQIQTGALDMVFITGAELSNRINSFNALFAPLLIRSNDHAATFLKNSELARGLLEEVPSGVGAVGLGFGMSGVRQVASRDAVATSGDLAGRKVRITPSAAVRDFNNLLGTAPTPMPLPEVYGALANGQVDAIEMNLDLIMIQRYHEHAPNVLVTNQMLFPMVILVSGRTWQAMSNSDRDLLAQLSARRGDVVLDQQAQRENDALTALEGAEGVRVVHAQPDFYAEVAEAWEKLWLDRAPIIPELRAEAAGMI